MSVLLGLHGEPEQPGHTLDSSGPPLGLVEIVPKSIKNEKLDRGPRHLHLDRKINYKASFNSYFFKDSFWCRNTRLAVVKKLGNQKAGRNEVGW